MKPVVIGTAGHIDHGKSSLVRALTGTDPDRFEEEKKRGITLDLGFAFLETDELSLSFVDVPGHERLVKNMIAGAVGFDLTVFAVDAAEGIKPQTVEHAGILSVLGVERAVIAVTKADRVDEARIAEVAAAAEQLLSGLGFTRITTLPTSIHDPASILRLKDAIMDEAHRITRTNTDAPFFMRIDRSFSLKGFGTVVTGTAAAGRITAGETLTLFPSGRTIRIKSVQVHGRMVDEATGGMRVALNISGVQKKDVSRGDLLSAIPLDETDTFAARISVFAHLGESLSLKHNGTYPLFIGTRHMRARLIIPGGQKRIAPGEDAIVTLRLDTNHAPHVNEAFVLRSGSPQETVAGGRIISVGTFGLKAAELPRFAERVEQRNWKEAIPLLVKRNPGGIDLPPMIQLTDMDADAFTSAVTDAGGIIVNGMLLGSEHISDTVNSLMDELGSTGSLTAARIDKALKPFAPEVRDALRDMIVQAGKEAGYAAEGGSIAPKSSDPMQEDAGQVEAAMNDDITLSNAALLGEKLSMDRVRAEQVLSWLANRGRVKRIAPAVFVSADTLRRFERLASEVAEKEGYVDVGTIRPVFDAPRKLLIPLLEHLDTTGRYLTRDRKRIPK